MMSVRREPWAILARDRHFHHVPHRPAGADLLFGHQVATAKGAEGAVAGDARIVEAAVGERPNRRGENALASAAARASFGRPSGLPAQEVTLSWASVRLQHSAWPFQPW